MGDAAKKLYDEAMKLSARERRAFALRVLASVPELPESQRTPVILLDTGQPWRRALLRPGLPRVP